MDGALARPWKPQINRSSSRGQCVHRSGAASQPFAVSHSPPHSTALRPRFPLVSLVAGPFEGVHGSHPGGLHDWGLYHLGRDACGASVAGASTSAQKGSDSDTVMDEVVFLFYRRFYFSKLFVTLACSVVVGPSAVSTVSWRR